MSSTVGGRAMDASLSPLTASSSGGPRRRTAAFSYSLVKAVAKSTSKNNNSSSNDARRRGVSPLSLTSTGGSAEEASSPTANGEPRNGDLSWSGEDASAHSPSPGPSGAAGGEDRERGGGINSGEYDFVDEVPMDYYCRLCDKLMEDPLQTQCCKTNYCRVCLYPASSSSPSSSSSSPSSPRLTPPPPPPQERLTSRLRLRPKPSGITCPECKTTNTKLKPNEELKSGISSLQVRCTYAHAGCVWEGRRAWLAEHLEKEGGCVYTLVICSDCGDEIRKKEEWSHATSECRMRTTSCQYCLKIATFEEISNHYSECPQYPVPCPAECGRTLPRDGLHNHLEYDCVKKGLKCPFREYGCMSVLLPVEEFDGHVSKCGPLHLGQIARKVTTDIGTLQEEIKFLRTENQSLREEVQRSTDAIASANKTILTLESRNEQLGHTLLCELEYYCHARDPEEVVAMECMKTQLASGIIHLMAGGSPATIRMTSYEFHKEYGQVWLSPSFSVDSGYKLRLAVHLNGVGAGKGSHVSIFLHQMAGERDDKLHWPYLLKDRVRVSLINQTQLQVQSPPAVSGKSSPNLFRSSKPINLSSSSTISSPPSHNFSGHFTVSLPQHASPLRHPRRRAEEQRTSPLKLPNKYPLVVVETQAMPVNEYLQRVKEEEASLGGRAVSKIELFCTQSRVQEMVHYDSLIFSVSLCSGNLSDSGHIACR